MMLFYLRKKGCNNISTCKLSQEFVKLWWEGDNQHSRISSVFRETQDISSSFAAFSLFCATHTLAKQASGDNRLGEWQSAPTCMAHL